MTLKDLRKQHDLTQRQLAKMVSVKVQTTRTAVGNWETGFRVPTRRAMLRLAEIFGKSYHEIESMFIGGDNGSIFG